ncbi:MAG: hypothetical protein MRZ71_04105 [Bacteroidales bacterium]|nr:hypothetical protein [Bacteroidales bacterium]
MSSSLSPSAIIRSVVPTLLALLTLQALIPSVSAQTKQEVLANGIQLFNSGSYAQAASALGSIASTNERDPKLNFYLGAATVMAGGDLDDALRRLHLAQMRNYMRTESNLYIGRAYQLQCEYEQAHEALQKVLTSSRDSAQVRMAQRFDLECQNALRLASKIFNVRVVNKQTIARADLLSLYSLSPDAGRVERNSHFFESDIDPNGIMYMTERADAVFFSLETSDGYSHLMKMEKLIGGWTEAQPLVGTAAAQGNDIMPLLMTDGVTLYFASDRPGGLGGLDIYRTTYDADTRSFSEPINMGVPFNSPYDDFLFVPDEFKERAWFASTREVHSADSLTVYDIIWDQTVVRSMAKTTDEIRTAMALNIDPEAHETALTNGSATRRGATNASMLLKEQFRLVVCDTLIYTQWEHFRSPQAARTYRQVLSAKAERDSLTTLMAQERKTFMEAQSNITRNQMLQGLLATERRVYSLDDEISDKTEAARNQEIMEVNRLISRGEYQPLCSIKVAQAEQTRRVDWQRWLRPENFSVYSPLFFRNARAAVDDEIRDLFNASERQSLALQDSLEAWSKIIRLQADQMESTTSADSAASSSPSEPLTPEQTRKRAAEYRVAADVLLNRVQDRRCAIYDGLYTRLRAQLAAYDTHEMDDLRNAALRLFDLTKQTDMLSASATDRDKVLLMKRRGMAQFDKCLSRYTVHADASFPFPTLAEGDKQQPLTPSTTTTTSGTVTSDDLSDLAQPTVTSSEPVKPAPQPEEPAPASEPEKEPVQEPEPAPKPEPQPTTDPTTEPNTPTEPAPAPNALTYKIQMGAFRTRPAALDNMPNPASVTSVPVEGRNLTRFYYGAYATRAQAEADLPKATANGFNGAFVVCFDAQGNLVK